MRLIIDIPEEDYNNIAPVLNGETIEGGFDILKTLEIIKNGTPLPKGHGRLKDVDKIGLTNFECFMCNGDYKEALKKYIEKIENAPTIIEADKEAEDEDHI